MGRFAGLGLLAAVFLAGCYGSTEPATNIRPDSAQLHARGTANDGPAYSYFEVERTWFYPFEDPILTPTRNWPAGASGPISENVTGLRVATDYRYRVCGGDAGEEPVCANYRSFRTPGPDGEDSVLGFWRARTGADPTGGEVQARRDPDGANPRGSLKITSIRDEPLRQHDFTGFVTCLRLDGNRATVGAVGVDRDDLGNEQPYTALASFEERVGAADGVGWATAPGSTPPDCGEERPLFGQAVYTIVVTDN